MLRTVYTPSSNLITLPIPDKYIGAELEIMILPLNEVSMNVFDEKEPEIDPSFGAWADMDRSTEEICAK